MLRRHTIRFAAAGFVGVAILGVLLLQSRGVQAWLLGQRGFRQDTVDERIFVESGVINLRMPMVHPPPTCGSNIS